MAQTFTGEEDTARYENLLIGHLEKSITVLHVIVITPCLGDLSQQNKQLSWKLEAAEMFLWINI